MNRPGQYSVNQSSYSNSKNLLHNLPLPGTVLVLPLAQSALIPKTSMSTYGSVTELFVTEPLGLGKRCPAMTCKSEEFTLRGGRGAMCVIHAYIVLQNTYCTVCVIHTYGVVCVIHTCGVLQNTYCKLKHLWYNPWQGLRIARCRVKRNITGVTQQGGFQYITTATVHSVLRFIQVCLHSLSLLIESH